MREWFRRNKRSVPAAKQSSLLEAEGYDYLEDVSILGGWKPTLTLAIGQYITAIETGKSDDLCQCQWIIHPDDVDLPKGKRRKARGTVSFLCPVHTREGFLVGFLDWMRTHHA